MTGSIPVPATKLWKDHIMDDKQAFLEINTAREMMGSTKTTAKQWDAMILGLGYLFLHEKLSERARTMMESTIFEASHRRGLIELWSGGLKS